MYLDSARYLDFSYIWNHIKKERKKGSRRRSSVQFQLIEVAWYLMYFACLDSWGLTSCTSCNFIIICNYQKLWVEKTSRMTQKDWSFCVRMCTSWGLLCHHALIFSIRCTYSFVSVKFLLAIFIFIAFNMELISFHAGFRW